MSQAPQQMVPIPPAPFGGRRPNPERIISTLNAQLTEKANTIRKMEDEKAFLMSLCEELTDEGLALKAMIDQVATENRVLRKRLGLPETGAIELTEDEAPPLEEVVAEPDVVTPAEEIAQAPETSD